MKSLIFSNAISNRNSISFLYGMQHITLDPYFTTEENGRKFIYGRIQDSSSIKRYEYSRIVNIKIIKNTKFSPIIPIMSLAS